MIKDQICNNGPDLLPLKSMHAESDPVQEVVLSTEVKMPTNWFKSQRGPEERRGEEWRGEERREKERG